LYWSLGDTPTSIERLNRGMELARKPELSKIRTWLLNGLAIITYEAGEYQKAAESYDGLVSGGRSDALLWINLSVVLCALGKNQEAITQGRKAVSSGTPSARLWRSLGYVYLSMGRPDDAAECFNKAIELAPANAAGYESLAVCYSVMGLPDESRQQLEAARKASSEPGLLPTIYAEALYGDPDKSASLLKAAVQSGRLSKVDVRRDPNIQIILDEALSRTLV
jgi:tetratricopeptide (TPR) repeat protein